MSPLGMVLRGAEAISGLSLLHLAIFIAVGFVGFDIYRTNGTDPRWWMILVIAICIALGATALHLAKYPPHPI